MKELGSVLMTSIENDQEVSLTAILDWLQSGKLSTEQAAAKVRAMRFPVKPAKTIHQQQHADYLEDPEPPQPGSFFAVSAAYAQGKITRRQYEALAQAAAQSIEEQHGDHEPARPVPGGAAGAGQPAQL